MEVVYGILLWGFLLIILPKLINKIESKSIFTLRKKPKLLRLCKTMRSFEKILIKVILFALKAIGILIIIILLYHLCGWIGDNPLWVIIILLIMILLKK